MCARALKLHNSAPGSTNQMQILLLIENSKLKEIQMTKDVSCQTVPGRIEKQYGSAPVTVRYLHIKLSLESRTGLSLLNASQSKSSFVAFSLHS